MTDRELLCLALAGGAPTNGEAINAVDIAFEFLAAEAESLVQCFEPCAGDGDYSRAVAHASRVKALGEFVSRHMTVAFRPEGSAES